MGLWYELPNCQSSSQGITYGLGASMCFLCCAYFLRAFLTYHPLFSTYSFYDFFLRGLCWRSIFSQVCMIGRLSWEIYWQQPEWVSAFQETVLLGVFGIIWQHQSPTFWERNNGLTSFNLICLSVLFTWIGIHFKICAGCPHIPKSLINILNRTLPGGDRLQSHFVDQGALIITIVL